MIRQFDGKGGVDQVFHDDVYTRFEAIQGALDRAATEDTMERLQKKNDELEENSRCSKDMWIEMIRGYMDVLIKGPTETKRLIKVMMTAMINDLRSRKNSEISQTIKIMMTIVNHGHGVST